MQEWQGLLRKVLRHGEKRDDRTGAGTLALFGESVTFDNRTAFPAVTTKRLGFEQMAAELACFLQGARSLDEFHKLGCTIWDGNGLAPYWTPRTEFEGDLGRIYGVQWRDWQSIDSDGQCKNTDQLRGLVSGLLKDPHSRRHIVTAFNPGELDQMCLPPCHLFFQCFVNREGRLDMTVYMRSVDVFLGLPFDVASYALLQRLLAQTLGHPFTPGFLTFFLGDTHIYLNHIAQVELVLSREACAAPTLALDSKATVFDFYPSQASLRGYVHLGAVPAPLNV